MKRIPLVQAGTDRWLTFDGRWMIVRLRDTYWWKVCAQDRAAATAGQVAWITCAQAATFSSARKLLNKMHTNQTLEV